MPFRDPIKPPKPGGAPTQTPQPVSVVGGVTVTTTPAQTIADGANTVEGSVNDAAVAYDAPGTISGKLRGLVKIFASVWDAVAGKLRVDASGSTVSIQTDPLAPLAVAGAVTADLTAAGGLPLKLGPQAGSASIPVVIASDQAAVPVAPPALQAITAADGADAAEGSTRDARALPDQPGSIIAQLRGLNEQMSALLEYNRQQLAIARAVLGQLNAMGVQQGVLPIADPNTISPLLN